MGATSPLLSQALLAHLPEIVDLDRLCFPEDPWGESSWAAEIGRVNSNLTVAQVQDEKGHWGVVGFLLSWWVLDEEEILKVAVHPNFRRMHIAKLLLRYTEMRPSTRTFFLEVREDNVGAILLYEQVGYRQYGKRLQYYHDGCTALLYRKIIER